jgi:hypothetical protein
MASYDALDKRVQELIDARYKEYQQDVLRRRGLADRASKRQKEQVKRRRDFMAAVGTDLKKLDAAVEKENQALETELKAFLEEARLKTADRRPLGAATSKDAAVWSAVLAESGHMVLPVYSSAIFTTDKSLFTDVAGAKSWAGDTESGLAFPDDPSKMPVRSVGHNPGAVCGLWELAHSPSPFWVHYAFVPAATASYEMTAAIAFHGFYILRCDDGVFSCRDASVKIDVQLNVHQYADTGWQDFPLLDIEKENADEITSYDRTHVLDYTTGLRIGDPVIVTVRGTAEALAHGGGAYAELNFQDGTANYIQFLPLAVRQV